MKTRQENLQIIRDACVAANPKERVIIGGVLEIITPIRLADVLLAVEGNDTRDLLRIDEYGVFWIGNSIEVVRENHKIQYNLRTDDITLQSDECIEFIAGLLDKKKEV